MKLVFDLQALQTEASRNRGIGRYTRALVNAVIAEAQGRHDIHLLLCQQLPVADHLLEEFKSVVDAANIHIFSVPEPLDELLPENMWRIRATEKIKAAFVNALKPDLYHINSLFEGFTENYVGPDTSTVPSYPTTVTLYDLIPYLNPGRYLAHPTCSKWYGRKLTALNNADLLLSISDFSRQEALDALGLPPERIVSISTDADPQFAKQQLPPERQAAIRKKFGLTKPFIMYTGGFDSRKNIEGLVQACASLPAAIRDHYQLAIICRLHENEKAVLKAIGGKCGMPNDMLVLTGFVDDSELVALYNMCHLFVFPSFHEGFGLPVLEAMRCGAAVIGSNCTSIPEIIGESEAMFDPRSPSEMTAKISAALEDEGFRKRLIENSATQEKKFSWQKTARKALTAFEHLHGIRKTDIKTASYPMPALRASKLRLAFVTPVKPQKSGIADYSADLMPALSRYYEIDIVSTEKATTDFWQNANCPILSPQEFEAKSNRYDRILYHFGNSEFHHHMFGLLKRHPGTIMLHDFFMSGIRYYMQTRGIEQNSLIQNLYNSHGYPALTKTSQSVETIIHSYPCNADILEQAQGVIVHSEHSSKLAEHWYGKAMAKDWARIPLLRKIPQHIDRLGSRKRLGIDENKFVVCSFGFMDTTKRNLDLIAAWEHTGLAQQENAVLVFVGACPNAAFQHTVTQALKKLPRSGCVLITGYADEQTYHDYLMAADIGVQLRAQSRGETSAAVQDCLAYGLPLIVNNHGSATEIAEDLAVKIPDNFTTEQLSMALDRLRKSPDLRRDMSAKSRRYAFENLSPDHVAGLYYAALEGFAANHPLAQRKRLVGDLTPILADAPELKGKDLAGVTKSISEIYPTRRRSLRFIDVTEWLTGPKTFGQNAGRMKEMVSTHETESVRIEPIYFDGNDYRYARTAMCKCLDIPNPGLLDEPVMPLAGDSLELIAPGAIMAKRNLWLAMAEAKGVHIIPTPDAGMKPSITAAGNQAA